MPTAIPCYVRRTVSGGQAILRATAAAAMLAAVAGCGGDEAKDSAAARADGTVEIERAAFAARQRIAQKSTFVLTVRNAGEEEIEDLTVTLRGFSAHEGPDVPARPLWLVDEPPAGSVLSAGDSYSTGPLAAGRRRTLRWRVTAVAPGTHKLDYEVAGRLASGDRARATLTVRVLERPPFSRVDPRTGEVVRE